MESVLIKLSGEFIGASHEQLLNFANQIKTLSQSYKIGIVIGGGNFFRGSKQGAQLKMQQSNADSVGMLATVMNGIILQDILKQVHLESVVLSAFSIDSIAPRVNQNLIDSALSQNKTVIFAGGTGNPFFTTDTNAVLRALQIGSRLVWKATKVDGIYSADPVLDSKAKRFATIEYKTVLENRLKIIDPTAITLAAENSVKIRVFNIFEKDALLKASKDLSFGSTIR